MSHTSGSGVRGAQPAPSSSCLAQIVVLPERQCQAVLRLQLAQLLAVVVMDRLPL